MALHLKEYFTKFMWKKRMFHYNTTDSVASNAWGQVGISRGKCTGSDAFNNTGSSGSGLFGLNSGRSLQFLLHMGLDLTITFTFSNLLIIFFWRRLENKSNQITGLQDLM